MDKKFLEEQKKRLEAEKKEIEDELKKLAESPNSFANHLKMKYPQLGYEEDENAEEVEQYMTNLGIEGYLEDALRNVKAALLRIKIWFVSVVWGENR